MKILIFCFSQYLYSLYTLYTLGRLVLIVEILEKAKHKKIFVSITTISLFPIFTIVFSWQGFILHYTWVNPDSVVLNKEKSSLVLLEFS